MKGYINSYNHLEKWFRLLETSAWNLYRGHVDKLGDNRSQIIYKQDNKSMAIDESWDMLKELIEINAANGGHFTIYVPSQSHNVGANVFFVAPNTLPTGSGRAALGSLPDIAGGIISKAELGEILEEKRRMWELERHVEDLVAAQESQVSGVERFFNRLLEDGTLGQIAIAGLSILGQRLGIPANPAQVSMNGFPEKEEDIPTDEEESDYEVSEEEIEFAVTLVDRFRRHFSSEQEMQAFLLKVADFFDKNTAVAKSFFK